MQQQTAGQQPGGSPHPPNAQPPAAVAAWHGSPVPDGNGTWYYQPNVSPPPGSPQNGFPPNGLSLG